jgi:hypothetical protein
MKPAAEAGAPDGFVKQVDVDGYCGCDEPKQ